MTIEEIELRKILTQILADNGINHETIIDIINKTIYKIIMQEVNLDLMINRVIKDTVSRTIQEEVAHKVRDILQCISIIIEHPKKETE